MIQFDLRIYPKCLKKSKIDTHFQKRLIGEIEAW